MILFFEQELTHYRVPIMQKLDKSLGGKLVVCYGDTAKNSYFSKPKKNLPFEKIELANRWFANNVLYIQNWWKAFRINKKPEVVISRGNLRNLSLFPLIFYCRMRGIPVILWGQGYSRRRPFNPYKNYIDRFHIYLVKSCDAYVCYTEEIRNVLIQYVKKEKLFVARNTLDTDNLRRIRDKLELKSKKIIKEELGLMRQYYIFFIGRIQKRKKVPFLIEVFRILKEAKIDIGLIIIGGGEDQEIVEKKVRYYRLTDVHLLGDLYGEEAGKYLYASDIMVIPSWLGLAVNHAFIFGLPVVTEDAPFAHPPEIAYLQNGYNGKLSEANNKEAMAKDILNVLKDIDKYSANAKNYAIENLSISNMINGFQKAVIYAKKKKGEK